MAEPAAVFCKVLYNRGKSQALFDVLLVFIYIYIYIIYIYIYTHTRKHISLYYDCRVTHVGASVGVTRGVVYLHDVLSGLGISAHIYVYIYTYIHIYVCTQKSPVLRCSARLEFLHPHKPNLHLEPR